MTSSAHPDSIDTIIFNPRVFLVQGAFDYDLAIQISLNLANDESAMTYQATQLRFTGSTDSVPFEIFSSTSGCLEAYNEMSVSRCDEN